MSQKDTQDDAFRLARRVDDLTESAIFAIKAKADALKADGMDVIHLDAGEPDFDTPNEIITAAKKALDDGFTHYTPVGGLPNLKSAIAHKLKRDNNLYYEPDQLMETCGAKQALFNAAMTLLGPNDEMLVPAPHWGTYGSIAAITGARLVNAPCRKEDGFILTPNTLEDYLTENTRIVVLNSPNNPTGQVYSREALSALGNVLLDHPNVVVLSDDIYEHLHYTGKPYANILNVCPSLKSRTVVINGVSKAYAMTGWRLGFAAGPTELITEMQKLQGQSTSHTASISQKAAEAAFNGDLDSVHEMARIFGKRAEQVREGFDKIEAIDCHPTQGGFYSFPDFSRIIDGIDGVDNDQQLGQYLLEELGLAMVPGSAFAAPGHMRLSFATDGETLARALERLQDHCG